MTQSLPTGLNDTFLWSEELGRGWHTRPAMTYTGDYFDHYRTLDATHMATLLTRARIDLVSNYCPPNETLDVGIGGGRYVTESGGYGYDVCADAVKWLQKQGKYRDPYFTWPAITCWDSLEHIPDPALLLKQVKEWLFVSLPICESRDEWAASKHFKPGEHVHYFTRDGFLRWCAEQGFECVEINRVESDLGREGIMSFAFKRVAG